MILKNKLGSGHIEVVISFVIFIGFLIFLFILFNPLKKSINETIVDSTIFNIGENASMNVTSTSIRINNYIDLDSYDCFQIPVLESLGCSSERKILSKNSSEGVIDSKIESGKIIINLLNNEKYYTLHCSEEISERAGIKTNCKVLDANEYNIGQIKTKYAWSEAKLRSFENKYLNSYKEIKEKFVSGGNDFSFSIRNLSNDEKFIGRKSAPKGIGVNSKTIQIELIDNKATIKKAIITVTIW